MSEQTKQNTPQLQTWLQQWPEVRQEIETLLTSYAEDDESLYFELTLANLELRDIDEALERLRGLGRLLRRGELTSAELEATGNT